ncbi:hypothetical protein TNCV_4285631 [Trichonephila clavipes]|nr:hypothetical protein TNCV_4285631 [Trichonephila clavipes]
MQTIGICKYRNHSNPVRAQQVAGYKDVRANRGHTRVQIKEDDVDFPGTGFTSEIVLPKRRLCYRSFAEILIFEAVMKWSTQ